MVPSEICRTSESGNSVGDSGEVGDFGGDGRTSIKAGTDTLTSDSDDPPCLCVNSTGGHAGCLVDLSLRTEDVNPPISGYVDRLLAEASVIAGADGGVLNVTVVDEPQMTSLHHQFKGVDGVTDVLAFDLRSSNDASLEADIVVCLDVAVRQATARGHQVRVEVLLYALHGLLHLLGMNDGEPDEASAMHGREDEILTAIGVGPIYHVEEGVR